jgi:propanol-preferring alcohol dehydrogenase
VRAAVLHRFLEPLKNEERQWPAAQADGITVRVLAAGVCHTDLYISDGQFSNIALPLVLGHEISAESDELGAVLVYPCWGCGECRHCRAGDEQLCPAGSAAGWDRDGGYAEYVAVPSARYLLPLEGLDPVRAAPLADAGVTPYRAVRRALPWLHPGSRVTVLGVGGLGQFAIQYLKLFAPSTDVVAVDVNPEKCARALDLGADSTAAPETLTAKSDVVFDFVGTTSSLAVAARIIERGGLVVQIGEGGGSLPFGIDKTEHEATFTTSIWASLDDFRAVLELARSGRISWEVEEFPLSQANAALERLRHGQISGRAVLRP